MGPIPTFPEGKEPPQTPSNTAEMSSRPLGRDGEGPPVELPPLGEGWGGALGPGRGRQWGFCYRLIIFLPSRI